MRTAVLAVLLCVAACLPSLAQEGIVAQFSDLRQTTEDRYPQTMTILAADFPAEHDALLAQIAELQTSAFGENARLLAVFETIKGVRESFRHKVRFAPIAEQAAIMTLLADFHETIFRDQGPAACGRFAMDGSGLLFAGGVSERYAAAIDTQSAAFLTAVVAAIENPSYHGEAVGEDWSAITREMIAAGAPWAAVETVANGNPADPALCPSLAAFFRVIAGSGSPEGERARAEFVGNVTGY